MINVQLLTSSSPVEKIGKKLKAGGTYSCKLKDNTSILRPTLILLSVLNPSQFNYMYIQDFRRYYFIDDIVSINNNIWEISAHVDVLETYKAAIKSNQAVIRRQANSFNLYLDDPEFKTYAYDQIQTKQFAVPTGGGFSKSMYYVLTVNGSEEEGGE